MRALALAVLVSSIAACAVPAAHEGDGSSLESSDEVAKGGDAFFTLRIDARKCAAPMCGGYFAKQLGKSAETYVSGLDFVRLGADDQAKVTSAIGDVIVRGHFGPAGAGGFRRLAVGDAYRALPSVAPAAGDAFFQVSDRRCSAAPCGEVATRLDSGATSVVGSLSVQRAARPFVDSAWLDTRVRKHGAIVAAHVVQRGAEKVLEASQIYVRIPDPIGPCPARPEVLCAIGLVSTHTRNADRCMVPSGCVKPAICPMFLPVCDAGYDLAQWTGPSGCASFACEPSFVK